MNKKNDRVISVKKVLEYILHRYVFIGVCLIICAIGMAALCYIKNNNSNDVATKKMTASDYDKMYEELSLEEKVMVESALYNYERLYAMQEYINNGLYLKIDPYNVSQTTIAYKVELTETADLNEFEKQADLNTLVLAYVRFISSGGLVDDIITNYDMDDSITREYLQEVMSWGYDSEFEESGCFVIGTNAGDLVPGLVDAMKESMQSYMGELNSLAAHKLVLIEDITTTVKNESVYGTQRGYYSEVLALETRLEGAVTQLSGKSLDYYNYKIEEISNPKDDLETAAEETEETPENAGAIGVPLKKLLKYGILGGILGIIGACGLLIFMYMFSKKIVSEDDYVATMGLKYFGEVRLSSVEEDLAFVVAKTRLICKKRELKEIAFVSSDFQRVGEDVATRFRELMSKQGIRLVDVVDVMKDCAAMDKLFEFGACVMLEKTGVSQYHSVYDIVQLCDENGIDILGVVDIKR